LPADFGKRRHSGEMSVKVNLKRIFLIFFTPLAAIRDFNAKKINKLAEKTLAEEEV
jgi:hypothetical protein